MSVEACMNPKMVAEDSDDDDTPLVFSRRKPTQLSSELKNSSPSVRHEKQSLKPSSDIRNNNDRTSSALKGKTASLSKPSSSCIHDITSQTPTSPEPASPTPVHSPSPPPPPIPTSPPPTGFDDHTTATPPPPTTLTHILSKVLDLQSQLCAFQSEVRVSLTTLAERLILMESRLGAKLDTVEVQMEYVDEETAA